MTRSGHGGGSWRNCVAGVGSAIATFQFLLKWFGTALEHDTRGNANHILNAKELAELIEQRQSETSIAAQLDRHTGKSSFQTRHHAQQHGHDAGVTGSIARSQTRREQAAGVALEDEHGVIHVLVVGTIKETELLLTVCRIVGGIDIQKDLSSFTDLFGIKDG